jgi:carbonic anhydrase/acetyltransferase-like protein (isoleucine patch superfamily)
MIMEFKGNHPKIDPTTSIAENAMVIGDVEIGPGSNAWFNRLVCETCYSFYALKSH